jgi:hypothetical protein
VSAPVDALAVMDQATRDCRDVGLQAQLHDAFAAIVELIAADEEYDAAWAVEWGEGGAAPKHVSDRRIAARERRAAALAAVGPQS